MLDLPTFGPARDHDRGALPNHPPSPGSTQQPIELRLRYAADTATPFPHGSMKWYPSSGKSSDASRRAMRSNSSASIDAMLLRERAVELVERDSCAWRGVAAAIRSATASAWMRSRLPLRNARKVNSPGSASRAPALDRAANDRLEHDRTAVRADLHDVLACVGAWSGKIGRDDLVQRVARSLLAGSANVGERRAPCLRGARADRESDWRSGGKRVR